VEMELQSQDVASLICRGLLGRGLRWIQRMGLGVSPHHDTHD